MRFKKLILLFCCVTCLSGCSDKEPIIEEPVDVTPPLSVVSDSITFKDLKVNAFGTWCGFILTDDYLEIHPFYDSTQHIKLERILLSNRPYWETIKDSLGNEVISTQCSNCEMITLTNGQSYAYVEDGVGYAYIFHTADLPSSYLKAIVERIELLTTEQ